MSLLDLGKKDAHVTVWTNEYSTHYMYYLLNYNHWAGLLTWCI